MGKVSDENAIEGLKDLIAKMLGIGRSEVELSPEMLSDIARMFNEKTEVRKLISPFYETFLAQNTKESKKKVLELIDLGKFIYCFKKRKRN